MARKQWTLAGIFTKISRIVGVYSEKVRFFVACAFMFRQRAKQGWNIWDASAEGMRKSHRLFEVDQAVVAVDFSDASDKEGGI